MLDRAQDMHARRLSQQMLRRPEIRSSETRFVPPRLHLHTLIWQSPNLLFP
jgi:hypothetical protein